MILVWVVNISKLCKDLVSETIVQMALTKGWLHIRTLAAVAVRRAWQAHVFVLHNILWEFAWWAWSWLVLGKLPLQILDVMVIVESCWSEFRLGSNFAVFILICICKLKASATSSNIVLVVWLAKEVRVIVVLLVKRNLIMWSYHFMKLLASWKYTTTKAKTIVRKGTEIFDSRILTVLEHVQHILTLFELMFHLLRLQVLTLQNTLLKI